MPARWIECEAAATPCFNLDASGGVLDGRSHLLAAPAVIAGPTTLDGVKSLAEPARGVALWWCDLERRARDAAGLSQLLSAAERERAARFGTDELRNRWIAGRATLRELLASLLGVAACDVPLRRGPRGRPALAFDDAPDFNVSHTRGAAMIAIGVSLPANVRIGVDIEREDRPIAADRLARKFLTARERASLDMLGDDARRRRFLRAWTYKEAMSKATGDGLIAPFGKLDLDIDDPPRLVSGPPPYDASRWQLIKAHVDAGYLGALALWPGSD